MAPEGASYEKETVMRKLTMVLSMFNVLCLEGAPGSGRCRERRMRVIPAEDQERPSVPELEYKKN